MTKIIGFLKLPSEVSDFERSYLRRVNRIALWFFALHLPLFTLIAWLNGTGPALAALLTTAVLLGPIIAQRGLVEPRSVSVVFGITAMFMGGLLVHFGQGPLQIEMHFYFFALIAMCAVFANPMVILAAAVTVTLHHTVVWLVVPRSVFNYSASIWVVAVHAAFVDRIRRRLFHCSKLLRQRDRPREDRAGSDQRAGRKKSRHARVAR